LSKNKKRRGDSTTETDDGFMLWAWKRNSCHIDTFLAMMMCVVDNTDEEYTMRNVSTKANEYVEAARLDGDQKTRDTRRDAVREQIRRDVESRDGTGAFHEHMNQIAQHEEGNVFSMTGDIDIGCVNRKSVYASWDHVYGLAQCPWRHDGRIGFGSHKVSLDGYATDQETRTSGDDFNNLKEALVHTMFGKSVSQGNHCDARVGHDACRGQRTACLHRERYNLNVSI
jgi:hypothetical protein